MTIRLAATGFALLLLCSPPASAKERITDFTSHVRVTPTGEVDVVESITVQAEGREIRHGILRDFPTTYTRPDGRQFVAGFQVRSVSLDGHPEPYTVEPIEAGDRVRIGRTDMVLAAGNHLFTLAYTTDRQIGFFKDHDEIDWNVTGNFWTLPIDHAEATIVLPAGGRILQFASYTGVAGSKQHNARADRISGREMRFQTTAPLGAFEGLTVGVSFAKGAVVPPSATERDLFFLRDNPAPVAAGVGLLSLLIYFAAVWAMRARRPRRGVIIPLFEPPRQLSPAAVRFVRRMRFDRKSYAASIVNMAVKGYLRIAEHGGVYRLVPTGRSAGDAALSHDEAAIARILFESGCAIDLEQANQAAIAGSIRALQGSLSDAYAGYFVTNLVWSLGAVAILLATAVMTALLGNNPLPIAIAVGPLAALLIVPMSLNTLRDCWAVPARGLRQAGVKIGNVGVCAAALIVLIALAIGPVLFGLGYFPAFPHGSSGSLSHLVAVGLAAGGIATALFHKLLKVPTPAGEKVLEQIEGFRRFLVTAEKDRLAALNPPALTPQVFDRFLPYAMALDCEKAWSRKFAGEAEASGRQPDDVGSYASPAWYTGRSAGVTGAAAFAQAFGVSVAAAAAQAAASSGVPGMASASGGSGFSGGGGGGGGGGGW